MKFEELELNNNVLDALYDMRFDTCTPVQEKCIPEILKGRDVLGVAQTGTGKTAAYLLPIMSKIDSGNYPEDAINCLITSPKLPVNVSLPGFPLLSEVSMKRISPPTQVHAKPVTTPA